MGIVVADAVGEGEFGVAVGRLGVAVGLDVTDGVAVGLDVIDDIAAVVDSGVTTLITEIKTRP